MLDAASIIKTFMNLCNSYEENAKTAILLLESGNCTLEFMIIIYTMPLTIVTTLLIFQRHIQLQYFFTSRLH